MAMIRIPPLYDWAKAKTLAMTKGATMRRFAKWHIWLAWLAGVPILMWTVTGLVMVAKPIEEVRGNHLRVPIEAAPLPSGIAIAAPLNLRGPVKSITTASVEGQPVSRVDYTDGSIERFDAAGNPIAPLTEDAARELVASRIVGGDQITSATLFAASEVPNDFRRPMAVWRIALADETYVYVGRDSGQIEAVRTRWWRIFDFMWGLHIMDLEERSDTSHPILIAFAAFAVLASLLGMILMFRRRKPRRMGPANGG